MTREELIVQAGTSIVKWLEWAWPHPPAELRRSIEAFKEAVKS